MSKRKKYTLAHDWKKILTPPGIELEKVCPNCGEHFRVVTARKLIAGKLDAWVVAQCGCSGILYEPNKSERLKILRRYQIRLVS
jgi:hypothetical protein